MLILQCLKQVKNFEIIKNLQAKICFTRHLSVNYGTLNDIALNFALCKIRADLKRTYKVYMKFNMPLKYKDSNISVSNEY